MEVTIPYYGRQFNDDGSIISSRSRNSIFKGFEENECPYSESDALEILYKLLEKGLIQLLESKGPEEVRRTNDPKYCKYHRIIGHPIREVQCIQRASPTASKGRKIHIRGRRL